MLGLTSRRASRCGFWECLFTLCWLLPRTAAAEAAAPGEGDSVLGSMAGTGGLFLAAGAGRGSFGLELGARCWVAPFFLTSLLAQYERLYWGYENPKRAHGVNLIARFEFTRWDDEYREHWMLPDASFYPLVGLISSFGGEEGLSRGIGYRVGLGITWFHTNGVLNFPLILQGGYQSVYFNDHRASGAYFLGGFGI